MGATGRRIATFTVRGVAGAMAMSGIRSLTGSLGLVEQTPPEAVAHHEVPQLMRKLPAERQQGAVEAFHWLTGAVAGALFGALPAAIRRPAWAGPGYGLAVLGGFEFAVAPMLGMSRAREQRVAERVAFAVDHVVYGLILAPPTALRPDGREGR